MYGGVVKGYPLVKGVISHDDTFDDDIKPFSGRDRLCMYGIFFYRDG
jgi:hypothetical protein